ncbi:alpha/beta hydrolase-fold protein [Nocardia nova]|uniref:alpha/beta hydrolase-fold protein n=1 Tax=Nocardia nova TaxID=37330 RepID=UPI0021584C4F|nr:alpha/beta hydrolase-fold protein [Nocardia nova]
MSRRFGLLYRRPAVLCLALAAVVALSTGVAAATDGSASADGSRIDRIVDTDARHTTLVVYSAAIDRTISMRVLRPAETSRPAPVLGRNERTTFLTRELPPLLDATLHTSGRNAIAGVSMSATSVLALAQATPGLYAALGSFSGCAQTGTDPGRRFVQAVVASGGGNPWEHVGPGRFAQVARR